MGSSVAQSRPNRHLSHPRQPRGTDLSNGRFLQRPRLRAGVLPLGEEVSTLMPISGVLGSLIPGHPSPVLCPLLSSAVVPSPHPCFLNGVLQSHCSLLMEPCRLWTPISAGGNGRKLPGGLASGPDCGIYFAVKIPSCPLCELHYRKSLLN